MKFIKIIGLLSLICFTFIYTEKIIDISIEQDEIMIKIKEAQDIYNTNPTNAIINNDTIIPGNKGKTIDLESSYKFMKKLNYYDKSVLIFNDTYPEISIYNNYNKYIINGNTKNKEVSLIYIISNDKTINNILNINNITFFIDSSFLNNNINIIDNLKQHEIYNYGNSGKYTKDNLIITNNIINNKSNNKSTFCLFLNKDDKSLNNCTNTKMHSIIPIKIKNYNDIKNNLQNGSIFLIENTQEINTITEYINSKGYKIKPLSNIIQE